MGWVWSTKRVIKNKHKVSLAWATRNFKKKCLYVKTILPELKANIILNVETVQETSKTAC